MGEKRVSPWRTLDRSQKHVLACTLAVNALLFFDQTAVAVALPALHHEFGASAVALQWTITAYLLALAAAQFPPAARRAHSEYRSFHPKSDEKRSDHCARAMSSHPALRVQRGSERRDHEGIGVQRPPGHRGQGRA